MTTPPASARIRRLTWSPELRDLTVALVAFGLTLVVLHGVHGTNRQLDPLGALLAAAACFPLVARRRSPLDVLVVTTLASASMNALGYGLGPPFGPTAALFFVAIDDRTRTRTLRTTSVVLGLFAVHVGSAAIPNDTFPTSPILFGVVVWGSAWVIGDQVRQRRGRLAEVRERTRRAARDLERERRLATAEERTRIARDLHDSAAHSINVILVQAGAARLLQQRDPEAVRAALATIEDVARETIGEIDQLVRTLRDERRDDETPEAIEPPVGLAALAQLIERHRVAGLVVDLHVTGQPRPLTPGLDQAVYRILQESLTNAARHGSGNAGVEVAYRDAELELGVSNPVHPDPPADETGGHGILGMRERAALLGGRFEAGRNRDSYEIHAWLPYAKEPL